MAIPQAAQKQMPVSRVGPLTMRGAVNAGLRDLSSASTASNSAASMIGGTFHHLGVRLALAGLLGPGVETVAADIGRARQHLVDGADAPAPAVAGVDAGRVEMLGDGLDTHRPRGSI